MSYEQQLRLLKLPTLNYRRIRGDMTEMHKFITGKNYPNCNLKLNFYSTLLQMSLKNITLLIEFTNSCME